MATAAAPDRRPNLTSAFVVGAAIASVGWLVIGWVLAELDGWTTSAPSPSDTPPFDRWQRTRDQLYEPDG